MGAFMGISVATFSQWMLQNGTVIRDRCLQVLNGGPACEPMNQQPMAHSHPFPLSGHPSDSDVLAVEGLMRLQSFAVSVGSYLVADAGPFITACYLPTEKM